MLEDVKRIDVAQERGQWRAVVGPLMYLGFHKRPKILTNRVSACQGQTCT